ncbi:MAG: hypothetical protein VKS61_11275 [Candidatus Sericytochromatia bacterium]|nr:hypothetical protein [Candidatus Sericytochromatia bacterium]
MPVPQRLLGSLLVATLAASACAPAQPGPPTAAPGRKAPGKAGPIPGTKVVPGATRAVAQSPLTAATLVGKVKLLSDNSGGLLSDNGGAVISNNSGALVSNHGAGLVGKAKYALAQAFRPGEAWLADALITVQDAAGRQLVGADGKPLQARTDGTGAYSLQATLPDENLLLRVELFNGGQLLAIVARQADKTRTVPVDTASTLGASYVLERFVKGDQQTFDRLPADEAETLRRRLAEAQRHLEAAPSYQPDESVALADRLREQDPGVAASFEAIKALLLGGLGDGKAATQVALNNPSSLLLDRDGTLLIAEEDFGRIRRLRPDGTLALLLDGRAGEVRENLIGLKEMALAPDGAVIVAARNRHKLYRIAPGRTLDELLGTGLTEATALIGAPFAPQPGRSLPFTPTGIATDADGTIYAVQETPARLVKLRPDGQVEHLALPPSATDRIQVKDVALGGPDGSLHVLQFEGDTCRLFRREASGSWQQLAQGLRVDEGRLLVTAEGTAYVAEDEASEGSAAIRVITAGGVATTLPLPTDDGLLRPGGLARAADGTLYVTDTVRNLVFRRSPEGAWRLIAGNAEAVQAGGDRITFNTPTWVTFDAEGRMLVTESGGHAIKRWNGTVLETIAGGARGFEGDGGPATAAHFDTPSAITHHGGELYVADMNTKRIRVIGTNGIIRTVAGPLTPGGREATPLLPGATRGPFDVTLPRTSGLAFAPDGTMYWSSMTLHQIHRLGADGQVHLVAGSAVSKAQDGDAPDGPATETPLRAPAALAFRPGEPDNLYFVEIGSCRVRRVVGLSSAAPRVETVAGLGQAASILRMVTAEPGWELVDAGKLATEALLALPVGLAFDAAGTMYVAEGGSTNAAQLLADAETVIGTGSLELPPIPSRIRRIDRQGRIETIVGPGGRIHKDPAAEDALGLAGALAVDPQGRLAVVDVRSNSVRIIPAEALR